MGQRKDQARYDAARVLDEYWDDDRYPVDPYRIARDMGISVYSADLDGDVSGLYLAEDGSRSIYIQRSDPSNRRRFTTAHEVGHAVEEPDGAFVDRKRDALARQGTDQHEIYANEFAACLLMPDFAVRKLASLGYSVSQMANIFGVSNTSMRFRLDNLGLG